MYRFSFCQLAKLVSASWVRVMRSDSDFAPLVWLSGSCATVSISVRFAVTIAAVYFGLKLVKFVSCCVHEFQPRRAAV